jgi:hypothetical protein
MKSTDRQRQGRPGLELIEEATDVLRTAPPGVLAAYYAGSLPFFLALLFFWADMSHSAFASEHLMGAALALGLLFLWMKFWHVVFAQQIRAVIGAETTGPWDWRRIARIWTAQTILQPSGLLLLPLGLLSVLPWPWLYAFYQNLCVLDDGRSLRLSALCQAANRQALRWPRQNIFALLILLLFSCFVLFNWCTVLFMLPGLVKTLAGVESAFSRSASSLFNSTTVAVVFALTFLSVDPIAKTMYVLRCFYGESTGSGADLAAELKQLVRQAQSAIAVVLAAVLFLAAAPLCATTTEQSPAPPPAVQGIPAAELDQSIQQVIQRSKYTWRMPRDEQALAVNEQEGIVAGFIRRCAETVVSWAKAVFEWIARQLTSFTLPLSSGDRKSGGYGWITSSEVLLFTLLALVASTLALVLLRLWQTRRARVTAVPSQPARIVPDLADENVSADQLPEDGWTKLGRELLARGELRLAMRAFYLSSLAHLASRQLIRLAKYKSNRAYERELRRRDHVFAELSVLFGENVSAFDQIWYGLRQVSRETVEHFAANVDRIRSSP